MREFTDDEVLSRVERLPTFRGWKRGPYDIWIRSKADAYDKFDDKVFTYWCEQQGERPTFIMACSGTTNAGSFGLKKFRTYNPLGCAVLASDTIVYDSHVFGYHKHIVDSGHEAYVEAKGFPYYRDGNMNNKAEEIGKVYTDVIGANCHRAGKYSTIILNWSVACLVRNVLSEFEKWLNFLKSKGRPPLSVAILKEW